MNKRRSLAAAAVGCILIVPASWGVFWKRGEKKPVEPPIEVVEPEVPDGSLVPAAAKPAAPAQRRAHVRLAGPEDEQALVQLADSRRLREEEIRVLARMYAEKQGELARMNQQLLERFQIADDANYQYDAEAKTLYTLTAKPGAEDLAVAGATAAEDLFIRTPHRTLSERDQELAFVRLVSAKKLTANELQVIQLLIKEKNLELRKVLGMLNQRFSIASDRHYEYDQEAQTLFEVVRAGAPAPRVEGAGNPE